MPEKQHQTSLSDMAAGELAVRLGTTPELLGAMLEHLQHSGHIQSFNACSDTCAECSLSNSCRQPDPDKKS